MRSIVSRIVLVIGLNVDPTTLLFAQEEQKPNATPDQKAFIWNPMLPEKELEGWEPSDFYENGKVSRADDVIIFEEGKPLTGITYVGKEKFPTSNYEIDLEARRTKGTDFLCGLTFPVGKGFCTFIAGGWGGGLVGLSSVDGSDASENATTSYHDFKNDKWYRFRVSVDDEFVRCWIDDDQVVTQERENHQFSTRIEVHASQPLGYCVYNSVVEVKNFRWRPLDSKEPETKPIESGGKESGDKR